MTTTKTIIIAAAGSAIGMATAAGGATFYMKHKAGPDPEMIRAMAEAVEHERYIREDEPNYVTVFSHVRPTGGSSLPVMVTLKLAGTRGLGAFCDRIPLVEETVLRALAANGLEARVGGAVNRVLAGKPVRGATARPMINPAAGGQAARDTEKKCKAVAKADTGNS